MLIRAASLCVGIVALSFAFTAGTARSDGHHKPAKSSPGFKRFKQLEGEWIGNSKEHGAEGEFRIVFKVTSAGSAVAETMFPGTKDEMLNVIHQDGDDIVLTHYCAIGNQPELKAPDKVEGKDVAFKFVRCGNMKSPTDSHMHDVKYTFVDNDTLRTTWTSYDDGKPAGTVVFEVKRKK